MKVGDFSFVNDSEQIAVSKGALSEDSCYVMVDPATINPESSRLNRYVEVHESPALLSSTLISKKVMN